MFHELPKPDEIYDYQRYTDANYLLEKEDEVNQLDNTPTNNFDFVL
jgi:hypothetical protein